MKLLSFFLGAAFVVVIKGQDLGEWNKEQSKKNLPSETFATQDNGDWDMEQPIYKLPGQPFYLLYTTTTDLMSCSFNTPDQVLITVTPGSSNVSTEAKRPPGWTWTWKGVDDKRDCGILINKAVMADSGDWQVVAFVKPSGTPVMEKVYVTILDAPDRIILDPDTIDPIDIGPDTAPDTINITCTAYETRGNVTFTWWIGDNMLAGNVSEYNITNNLIQNDTLRYKDVSQILQYVPDPSHDGKQLTCNASHSQYENDDLANNTNIASIDITITAPPVPSEEDIVFQEFPLGDNSIEILFHANPGPEHIFWVMHDMGEPLADNQTSGRYTSEGWEPAGSHLSRLSNGDYIATLQVNDLSRSDAGLQNKLWVQNRVGNTSYVFTFDAIQGLTVGEIAGIAVGCVAAVILVGVLVGIVLNNRRKKRSKKIKQERKKNREERREESRAQGQENPEFEDVAM